MKRAFTLVERGGPALTESDYQVFAGAQLFAGVPRERIRDLLRPSGEVVLRAGDTLFEPGERHTSIYLLMAGRLAVRLDDDAQIPVAHIEPGECVGELAVIDDEAASAQVTAVETSRLLATDAAHLWKLMAAEPAIALNLMKILAARLRHSNAMMADGMQQQAALRMVSSIDPLTGLHNRRWMNEMFLRQIDRCARRGEPLCLAMLDLDHFKSVNDTYGHLAGDQMLVRVARSIQQHFRPTDLVARYGGEEFAVLLPEADLNAALAAAERLRLAVERTAVPLAQRAHMFITISVGVAQWREGWSLEELIAVADRALYEAKQGGRNQVRSAA